MSSSIEIVSSTKELLLLLDSLPRLPANPPSLYFDIEGIRLGRLGSVSLLLLHVAPSAMTYIIDVYTLGECAFLAQNNAGISFKAILESDEIPKVFFDIRNDSDALFSHYKIGVRGIVDIQLLELATRSSSIEFLAGLAKCICGDLNLSSDAQEAWKLAKESGRLLYDPREGGRYEVFNDRPISPEILLYCKQDVELLPLLWATYSSELLEPHNAFWRSLIREATKRRIELSQHPSYDGQAESKVCGPWDRYNIEFSIEDWNNDVTLCAVHLGMILDHSDTWIYSSMKQAPKSSVFALMAGS